MKNQARSNGGSDRSRADERANPSWTRRVPESGWHERTAEQRGSRSAEHTLLRAQRTHGNQAFQRLIADRRGPTVQPKLLVGRPDDKYEREADRVAEAIVRMPDTRVPRQPTDQPRRETLSPSPVSSQISPIDAETEARIESLRGGGTQLSPSVQAFFEPRFGADFTGVRIHDDSRGARVARSIEARAFTVGSDIIFGDGEYSPHTSAGKRLLAHELAHVVQQNRNLRRSFPADGSVQAGHSTDESANPDDARPLVAANDGTRSSLLQRTTASGQHSSARGVPPDESMQATRTDPPRITTVPAQESDSLIQRENDDAGDAGSGGTGGTTPTPTPAQPAPGQGASAQVTPTLSFGTTGTTLTRGDTLTATVNFTPVTGETLRVTRWRYSTPGHGTVTRPTAAATFQSSWSGTMAVSGDLEMQYTITPAGESAGQPQSVTEAITVEDRTGTNWQSSVTNAAEGTLAGKPSPPRQFSDLGFHQGATSATAPTTSQITGGPNRRFTYVSSMAAGTYTSTPSIHPDLTGGSNQFQTFHSDPSILFLVVGSTKTRIPNAEYSGLSTSGTLSFTVPNWETFYKGHNFYRVRATRSGGQPVTLQDAWWGLASNAENANISIRDEPAIRAALGGSGGPYNGAFSISATPRGTWDGYVLMQAPAILTGTRSHEYVHGTHSHRANFTKMVRALDPRKVLERTVSAPGQTVNFANKLTTLHTEILRPNHEIVDEAASATAERFVPQVGVTMAGINEDPATGATLGTVWNISGNAPMQ